MGKSYDSVVGAKLLLALAYEKGFVLNVTKVQKILYIIYGYFLAKEGREIFTESPRAWPYGPVFPRTRKRVDFGKVYHITDEDIKDIASDDDLKGVFNKVIDKYAKFSAAQLSDWSHMEGGAWDKTVKQAGFNWNNEIPNEFISEYFSQMNII